MLKLKNAVNVSRTTYASQVNSRYFQNSSQIVSAKQRWDDVLSKMPYHMQQVVKQNLPNSISEFRARNPSVKKWKDLTLAEAVLVKMDQIHIDVTMQRLLNIAWVLTILGKFSPLMVVPIQVYRDPTDPNKLIAWDGQHTLITLWLISKVLGEDPSKIEVPVNIYKSSLKAQMRANFLSLNSDEGKKALDAIDHWMQQVYGVRIDNSDNPIWIRTEEKQQLIEKFDLFVTAKKFGDEDEIGAISRLQEINKLSVESVGHLCRYLYHTAVRTGRPAEEKEMVMMGHYFDRCSVDGIDVTDQYIDDLAEVTSNLWDADFSPAGPFWEQVKDAYINWHTSQNSPHIDPRCKKEPIHGFPFMVAQLNKSLSHPVPRSDSNSNFWPASSDLF